MLLARALLSLYSDPLYIRLKYTDYSSLLKLNTFPNFETPAVQKLLIGTFFWPFERLLLIFSAIFWYCMITRQLIVKKCQLTTPEIAKKKF
jgi:hypothetical protein